MRGYFRKSTVHADKNLQAYVIGLALGDGNLSNSNKRAIRLRITCDKKYPILLNHIATSLQLLFPENRVGLVQRAGCVDVSVHSNALQEILPWKWDCGPKDKQNVGVPDWIQRNTGYTKHCLRGLFQTDGSIYKDRGYIMVNFTNTSQQLAENVFTMVQNLGYKPNMQKRREGLKTKHTIRISKNTAKFIRDIDLWKR